jgi:hypothetical protein
MDIMPKKRGIFKTIINVACILLGLFFVITSPLDFGVGLILGAILILSGLGGLGIDIIRF